MFERPASRAPGVDTPQRQTNGAEGMRLATQGVDRGCLVECARVTPFDSRRSITNREDASGYPGLRQWATRCSRLDSRGGRRSLSIMALV